MKTGIVIVADLLRLTGEQFMKIRNLKPRSREEIVKKLERMRVNPDITNGFRSAMDNSQAYWFSTSYERIKKAKKWISIRA